MRSRLSDPQDIIEYMFDTTPRRLPSPEVIARFDELFERRHPTRTAESAALLDQIGASWRAQNRAAAAGLAAVGELFAYRLSRCSDTEDWAVDTESAVSAEVGAALRMSQGLAASQLRPVGGRPRSVVRTDREAQRHRQPDRRRGPQPERVRPGLPLRGRQYVRDAQGDNAPDIHDLLFMSAPIFGGG